MTGLGEGLIEKLNAAGVTSVEALADMTPEQLEAIEGIGPKTVEKISLAVNNYFSSLEAGGTGEAPVVAKAKPLRRSPPPKGRKSRSRLQRQSASEDLEAAPAPVGSSPEVVDEEEAQESAEEETEGAQ